MMWGCISWEGVGYATRIEGRMDADLYVSILENELQQSIKYFKKRRHDLIFQQDNNSRHTSKKAKTWFQDHRIHVMQWSAQSPDLNPVENLWQQLKQRLATYEYPAQGINELQERVEGEQEEIEAGICQNLIEGLPKRVLEVYMANRGQTNH